MGPESLNADDRRDLLEIVEDNDKALGPDDQPSCLSIDGIESIGNPGLGGAFWIVSSAMPRIEHLGDSLRKIRKPDQAVPKARVLAL
jgi:hypothetical protein